MQELDLMIYTGTNGVMELDDINGNKVPIYLHSEDNRLKVPKFFWKLVVDEATGAAAAAVGVNNVHLSRYD